MKLLAPSFMALALLAPAVTASETEALRELKRKGKKPKHSPNIRANPKSEFLGNDIKPGGPTTDAAVAVSCGGHNANSCAECPQGNGANWCNGVCHWVDGACEAKGASSVSEGETDSSKFITGGGLGATAGAIRGEGNTMDFDGGRIQIQDKDPEFSSGNHTKELGSSKKEISQKKSKNKRDKKRAKKNRKAPRKGKKGEKKNRKQEKAPKTGLEIIGGNCVSDHKCAEVRGDPHIKTFDGFSYDCQGQGEFVLAKSLQTAFEIQGRFGPPENDSSDSPKAVTITTAISIDTGVTGAPKLDLFAENVDGTCIINYYVDDELVEDWGDDGLNYKGLEFMEDVDAGRVNMDYAYFTESGLMYSVYVKSGSFGCVLQSKICLPPAMVTDETIIGLLGSPNDNRGDDWMTSSGGSFSLGQSKGYGPYEYCTTQHCVMDADDSIFMYLPDTAFGDFHKCGENYDGSGEEMIANPSSDCKTCCNTLKHNLHSYEACLLECMEGGEEACVAEIINEEVLAEAQNKCPDSKRPKGRPAPPKESTPSPSPDDPPAPDSPSPDDRTTDKAFTKGDPHFKTFGGELYDYHGECDLVLLHNPDFKYGLGMDIHIRTKIQDFWSSVESAAIKLGDETMEIRADPSSDEWLWFNGKEATSAMMDGEWHKHEMAGFLVRYKQNGENTREANLYLKGAKEVLVMKTFKSFVRIDVNWQESDNYFNSNGLLGDHAHEGKRLGRDGEFIEDVKAFGQEWQVVPEVDGILFHSYEGAVVGKQCVMPPSYKPGMNVSSLSEQRRRLGESTLDTEMAEKACNHLVDPEEIKACVFDVVATQDLNMASTW